MKKKYPPGWETSECSEKHLLTTLNFPESQCVRLDTPRHVMQDSVQYIGSGDKKWHRLTTEEQAHHTLLGTQSKTDCTNLVLCVWFDTLVLTHHLSLNSDWLCYSPANDYKLLQMLTHFPFSSPHFVPTSQSAIYVCSQSSHTFRKVCLCKCQGMAFFILNDLKRNTDLCF